MADVPLVGVKGGPVGYGNPPAANVFPPGTSGNPGGRPKGADVVAHRLRELAKGCKVGPDGEVIEYGEAAIELSQVWFDIATGKRDPSSVDSKAMLALIERASGAVVKESLTHTNDVTQVIVKGVDAP